MNYTNHTSESELRSLVENAKENEAKLQKFQAIELSLIAADSFSTLYQVLTEEYRRTFGFDGVVLILVDLAHEIRRIITEMRTASEDFPQLKLIDPLDRSSHLSEICTGAVLRPYREETDEWIFDKVWPHPESVALLPLKRGGAVIGSLCLSSSDPDRFAAKKSNAFLSRLAAIAGICVENTLNTHRLRTAGITDPLTGAKNRRFHDERLFEEVARARRSGSGLAFLFIDIDHFKRINDQYGHPVGDLMLQAVAQRIAGELRVTDVLTRYGGEEFAVLQPDTDILEAKRVAKRILKAVSKDPFEFGGEEPLALTVSIGIATMDASDYMLDGGLLTKSADDAMLEAKRRGRNQVVLAPQTIAGVGT